MTIHSGTIENLIIRTRIIETRFEMYFKFLGTFFMILICDKKK